MFLVVEKFLYSKNKSQAGCTYKVKNSVRVKEQQFDCEVFIYFNLYLLHNKFDCEVFIYFNLYLMHNKKLYSVHASLRSAIIMTSSTNELS